MTYFQQALWLHKTGRGYADIKVEAEKALARHYAEQRCQKLEILCNHCCDSCSRFEGRTYRIEQALSEWPVPVEECTNGWCLCSWLPVVSG